MAVFSTAAAVDLVVIWLFVEMLVVLVQVFITGDIVIAIYLLRYTSILATQTNTHIHQPKRHLLERYIEIVLYTLNITISAFCIMYFIYSYVFHL